MSKRSDDTYRQVEMATDDLIKAMGKFRAAVDDEVHNLVGKVRGEQVITRRQAEFQAMQTPPVKNAVQDCHWASERVNAFGMAYLCAVTRMDELSEREELPNPE